MKETREETPSRAPVSLLPTTSKRLLRRLLIFCFMIIHPSGEDENSLSVSSNSAKSDVKVKSSAQLNMRGVYLHVLGDALGSVIVIISALIIKYASGKWTVYVDPGMSILMVCLILKSSIPLMRESSMILLQTVPTHIKIKEVQDRLLGHVEGVLGVHEFHVWQLAGNKIIGEF